MTGGSLGLRTGSYGSLQQQFQGTTLLPIQTTSARKNPKMLSREKERIFSWIYKYTCRRRVGMLLMGIVSIVVFTSLMSIVTKDGDVPDVPETHNMPTQNFLTWGSNMESRPSYYSPPSSMIGDEVAVDKQVLSVNSTEIVQNLTTTIAVVSDENRTMVHAISRSVNLPPDHPCEHFAFSPPPADRKRIGPRSCPVCYLPVDQALPLMPTSPSPSPVLKHLTYITEDTSGVTQQSGGSVFGGFPSLKQRNDSYDIKESMNVHCGFTKGNRPGQQTGFDIDDSDLLEMEQCHGVVVASAIFGNYDILQQPKNISEAAKRDVCFYMFVDEETEAYIRNSSVIENDMRVGLWRIVVVRNLPYADARRNGKVPKLLLHRLFTNARYSIWIDGKLELIVDPYQILERFLWRNGATFAISRHYRRFDVFEEAEANKAAAKYSNASIDEQIEFYKGEGLTPYSEAKLPITSDVPEGCVIIREHIPITNLFTCLWFNEVDRFTSRDQLSFSTARDKIMAKVDWSVNMFLDCERRNFVIQAYHRDLLEHMASIHPPPPDLATEQAMKPLQLTVPEKIASNPPSRKVSPKRGRDKRQGSRRHRKIGSSRDGN